MLWKRAARKSTSYAPRQVDFERLHLENYRSVSLLYQTYPVENVLFCPVVSESAIMTVEVCKVHPPLLFRGQMSLHYLGVNDLKLPLNALRQLVVRFFEIRGVFNLQ